MQMHKEHNGAAHVQKSSDMCSFTPHISRVLKNHIDKKHQGILKTFECNKCDFPKIAKVCLSIILQEMTFLVECLVTCFRDRL